MFSKSPPPLTPSRCNFAQSVRFPSGSHSSEGDLPAAGQRVPVVQCHTSLWDSRLCRCCLRHTAAGSFFQFSAPQQTETPPGPSPAMAAGEFQILLKGRSPAPRLSQGLPPERRSQRKPSKKLRVIICVLLVELCERFTFFGIVCNMILFCTVKLGYDNRLAATVNLCFIGASTLSPVLVGWFAETVLGRTKVLYLCTLLHFFGKRSSYKHYRAPKKTKHETLKVDAQLSGFFLLLPCRLLVTAVLFRYGHAACGGVPL